MGEEVRINDYDVSSGDDDGRAMEWEAGLPNADDLPPLSQFLISPDLASAFNITPEPHRSMSDVTHASRKTLSTLRRQLKQSPVNKVNDNTSFSDDMEEEMVAEGEDTVDLTPEVSDSRKLRRVDSGGAGAGYGAVEEADSTLPANDSSVRTLKRNRLVWTSQLHKRFVEVVTHLGVKNAVPKTIMQLMNVEGLSRENVASHLQKYRLYVKRMHGLSIEGPAASDHKMFHDSGGVRGNQNWHATVPVPLPYMPHMVPSSAGGGGGRVYHNGFEYHPHPYNMMQPKDCSGNNFKSVSPYQHRMRYDS